MKLNNDLYKISSKKFKNLKKLKFWTFEFLDFLKT